MFWQNSNFSLINSDRQTLSSAMNSDSAETERRLDMIIANLEELSADLDVLLLLSYDIDGLSKSIDRFCDL